MCNHQLLKNRQLSATFLNSYATASLLIRYVFYSTL